MSHSIAGSPPSSLRRADPLPYWNPYLVGVLLGLVLLATYLVTGRGLGATGAFSSVATWLTSLVSSVDHITANPVHAKYWNDGAPLASWTVFLLGGALLGGWLSGLQGRRINFMVERGPRISDNQRLILAFVGGLLAAYGAKLAKGCTSGQALTGGAILNAGSLAFMVSVFAAAYGLAWFVRKEWI
jgi:uncharacterized membrane protein YedE/YeeE